MVGYILIQTEVGKGPAVTRAVSEVEGIVEADAVTGPYDVIARADAEDLRELSRTIVDRIQEIEGVSRTLTCPVMHG